MISWPIKRLGEILRRVERFESRDEFVEYPFAGTYSFARGIFVGERKLGSTFSLPKVQRLRVGDFVYCKIMAWEGAFGIVPAEADGCVMSGAFVVYELDHRQIEPKFLEYYFRIPDNWKAIGAQSTGTNVRRQSLHPDQFENSAISFPSLPEQRRIVARIEELAAKINEARGLRQEAKKETEGFLSAAMKTHFDFSGASSVVGDYVKVQGGYAFSSDEYDELGTHQIVRIGNVRDGFLDLSRAPVHWSPGIDSQVLKYELRAGDLVISMTGTRNKRDYGFIGKVPEGKNLLLNQRVGRLIIRKEIDRDYLFHFLRSPFFRDRLFPSATGTANQANVGNNDIERIPFAPPVSLSEQRRVIAELDGLEAQMDRLKKLQIKTDVELDALLPSILDQAFKGDL